MPKKNDVKLGTSEIKSKKTSSCTCHGNGFTFILGIIILILGITLWFQWLTLVQVFAIIFILMGLKKIIWKNNCH